ncbi:MAG TPA: hypothetical protein DHV17_04685 [Chitinophagaceae bacterium]|nr:hypothetical protein [Chitinophagaceae bacterium]
MTDAELATLHSNSKRLMDAGTAAQQKAAEALIPSITAELSARSEAVAAGKAQALALRRANKLKPSPAVAG